MLTMDEVGKTIARVASGKLKGSIVSVVPIDEKVRKEEHLSLKPKEGVFDPIPSVILSNTKDIKPSREILYICGPSGVGKSTFCANYIRNFNKLFPKKKVYVLSRMDSDDTFAGLNITRIECDESLVTMPIDIHSECETGCMFMFDDCDTITDESVRNAVTHLMFDILETGRHKEIYCLITSHVMIKGSRNENARIFNEMHRLVLFPGGCNRVHAIRVLTEHLGIGGPVAKKILGLKTRWICIGKNYPQYLLTASDCQTL